MLLDDSKKAALHIEVADTVYIATPVEMKTKFKESDFELRTPVEFRTPVTHEQQCISLDSKRGSSQEDYSKDTGINHTSVLEELRYFSVASGALVSDVMHDVLEGVLQYERSYSLGTSFVMRDASHWIS